MRYINKALKVLCMLGCAAIGTLAQAQTWTLVWSDEFSGNELDLGSWSFQTGTGTAYGLPAGWGNNELQYYTNFPSNLTVSDGTLKITARHEDFGGQPYTSARIHTAGKRDFLYGRFEARMKLPSTSGVWPAFWMLPTTSPYGIWAASGEMDIMESVNLATRMYGTIHFGGQFPNNQFIGTSLEDGTDFSQAFHDFAIEWSPDEIRWFIDGVQFFQVSSDQWFSAADPGNPRAPFDVPFHLLLNVAVGGNFPGDPNGTASYPQTLEVDYVRVYESTQSPFGGSPHPVPGTIEAEDFDIGVNGQSHWDCDATNNGGAYRDTEVDIQPSTESGFNVGWICQDEWLEYTVDVQAAGDYQLDTRVASLATGGLFRIESDGVDLSGPIVVPSTQGWQNWATVSGTVHLDAGVQILRFVNLGTSGQEYNFNAMTLLSIAGCSAADFVEPFGSLDFFDIAEFLALFSNADPSADFNGDGIFDFFDVADYLSTFAQGCP